MQSIFSYDDYRQYLKDYYKHKKTSARFYSYHYFAKKADLGSPNYFKLVMDGKRNLSYRNILKFAKGLGLDAKESHYFECLVYFNQAKSEADQALFKNRLELAKNDLDRHFLSPDQHEMLSSWYFSAIKELILLHDFQPKPKWIAKKLDYKITPEKAKDAVALLLKLQLIHSKPDGTLAVSKQNMQTADTTNSRTVAKFHEDMLDMAKSSIKEQSSEVRCLSALTFAIEKKKLAEAFKRIHEFRNELDTYFSSKKKSYDAVYQLNIQLFRLDCDD